MSDLNIVTIQGRLTRDIETRKVGETTVAGFGLASSRVVGKNKTEKTVFIDVDAWGGLGETCAKFLEKGRGVIVTGKLRLDQWTDKEGGKRSKLSIDADDVIFLSSGKSRDEQPAPAAQASGAPASRPVSRPAAAAKKETPPPDDDVPF
jgi:single-strand DNA-binding protein